MPFPWMAAAVVASTIYGSKKAKDAQGASAYDSPLSREVQQALLQRIRDPTSTSEYRMGSAEIRRNAEMVAAASRQRLGEAGVGGGFFESGTMLEGLQDIERGKISAVSTGIGDLISSISRGATAEALPYLSGQESARLQEFSTRAGIEQGTTSNILGAANIGFQEMSRNDAESEEILEILRALND